MHLYWMIKMPPKSKRCRQHRKWMICSMILRRINKRLRRSIIIKPRMMIMELRVRYLILKLRRKKRCNNRGKLSEWRRMMTSHPLTGLPATLAVRKILKLRKSIRISSRKVRRINLHRITIYLNSLRIYLWIRTCPRKGQFHRPSRIAPSTRLT